MSYGYNKYSNSNMSSRGRGFNSRGGGGGGGGGGGSYRGRGGGGGSSGNWDSGSGGSNMSRGGYGSSRGGRFKYSTPNYDSRNKYNSSGGSDRSYSSRGGGRGDHSNNYKRPRDSYSSRDDHRSSSESNRKRVRNDSYQGEGSSGSQRYGGSSYGGSTASAPYNDNKRSSSSAAYEDKRPSDRSSSYHRTEERHSSASRNYAAPPPPRISDMAPPSQRYTSSRGRISHQSSNYRGRISTRGRGTSFRVSASRSDLLMSRKRALTSTLDYRRKLLTSRSRDYIQRVRLASTKMRRSVTTRLSGSKKESTTSSSIKDKDRELAKAINAEFSDDDDEDKDVEENWEVDDKTLQADDDEEVTNNDAEKKTKDEKRKKEKPERQSVDEHEEEKDQEMKEGEGVVKQEREEDEAEGERDENEKEEGSADGLPSRRDGRRFIKLHCPHCAHRSVTFKEYSLHLFSGRHNTAMRRIAARHKANLARMRVLQRQEQRRHEARESARGTLPSRTMFCQICKLNYRSMKAMHHMSDSHRQMKRFLTPFCRVCRIQFRSPMLFETHVCSLDHIKRKNLLDERLTTGNGDAEGESSGPGEDDKEVNLDNFMTLDSVGDVDAEEDEETSGDKKKKEKPDGSETNASPEAPEKKQLKNKQMIKVGAEYVKRVEAQFCELCKMYLPRNENAEKALAFHCSTRSHLKRYVRDNDDKALRRQAERIHLQTSTPSVNNTSTTSTTTSETTKPTSSSPLPTNAGSVNSISTNADVLAEGEQSNEQGNNISENEINKSSKSVKGGDEEEEDDYRNDGDKLWEDVDKDLGDILREVEPGKSSDDEDSRYDRFKNSEKKIQQLQHAKDKANDLAEIEESKKLEIKVKIEKPDK